MAPTHLCSGLENPQPTLVVKPKSLSTPGWDGIGLEILRSRILERRPSLTCSVLSGKTPPALRPVSDLIERSPSMAAFSQETTSRVTRASSKMWLWGRGPPLSPLFTLQGLDGAFPQP